MFSSILRHLGIGANNAKLDAESCAMLAVFIREVEPKFALLPDYKKQLGAGILRLQEHAKILAQSFQEPVELSFKQFSHDRRLGIFFFSPLSLLQTIKRSRDILNFFSSPQSGDVMYGMLLMRYSEKTRFGLGEKNGIRQSDMLQQIVSFDQHNIVLCAKNQAELNTTINKRISFLLCRSAAMRLQSQDFLRVKLQAEANGLEANLRRLHNENSSEWPQLINTRLDEVRTALANLNYGVDLGSRLRHVSSWLDEPDKLLQIVSMGLSLDRMGVVQCAREAGSLIHFEQVTFFGKEDAPEVRVVLPIKLDRNSISNLEQVVADGY